MGRGVQGAAVVLGVHHGHVGAAVVQHLLHAVYAAALAARADRGAGDRVVAAQAVHLAAGCFTVLHGRHFQTNTYAIVSKLIKWVLFVLMFMSVFIMLVLIHVGLTKRSSDEST